MRTTTDSQSSPAKRSHTAAFVAAALFAAIFLLANIPGQPIVDVDLRGGWPPGSYGRIVSLVHGWPLIFLRHDADCLVGYAAVPSAWRVGSNAQFTPMCLVANIAVLLVGILVTAKTVHWWLHKCRWQFRILDVIVATSIICVVAAYVSQRLRLHDAQVEWTALRIEGDPLEQTDWQPFGPYWLRSITGPRIWSWGDRLIAAEVQCSDEIGMLPGPHSIRVLKISSVNLDSMPSFEAYGRLVAISFESAFWFRNDNFVRYSDADLSELLAVVAQYKSLEGLNLHRSPVKDRETSLPGRHDESPQP